MKLTKIYQLILNFRCLQNATQSFHVFGSSLNLILQSQDATLIESNNATFKMTVTVRMVLFQLACGHQDKSTLTYQSSYSHPLLHMKMLCHQDA